MNIRISVLLLAVLANSTVLWAQKPIVKTMAHLTAVTPPEFIVFPQVVIDTVTTLMWQRLDGGEMTWEQARTYCDTLTLGGFTDWRMANGHELFSIHDLARKNPALPAVFTSTAAEYWWSSDTLVGDRSRIWCTNAGGGIGPHPMSETVSAGGTKKYHVRAVRATSEAELVPSHYTDLGNDLVLDHVTDRMWQQYCEYGPMPYEQALVLADTAQRGGFTDWRLPDIKELESLRETLEKSPCVDMMFFPCVMNGRSLWSSTTLSAKSPTQAWLLQPELGIVTYGEKATSQYVLLVRGGGTPVTNIDEDTDRMAVRCVVYPNPVTDVAHLITPTDEIHIYSVLGEMLAIHRMVQEFSTQDLVPGTYIIVLFDRQGSTTSTIFIKQ